MSRKIISAKIDPQYDGDVITLRYSDGSESEEALYSPPDQVVEIDGGVVGHEPDRDEWKIIDAELERFSREHLRIVNIDFEKIAGDWVHKNVVLAEHCDIEYSDVIKSLTALLSSVSK